MVRGNERFKLMKITKSSVICIAALSTLYAYGNSDTWISFLGEVAGCRNDSTNRDILYLLIKS